MAELSGKAGGVCHLMSPQKVALKLKFIESAPFLKTIVAAINKIAGPPQGKFEPIMGVDTFKDEDEAKRWMKCAGGERIFFFFQEEFLDL